MQGREANRSNSDRVMGEILKVQFHLGERSAQPRRMQNAWGKQMVIRIMIPSQCAFLPDLIHDQCTCMEGERNLRAEPHGGAMEDFATALLDCGLIDGGFKGNLFTWTKNLMFQRLDRMVYIHQWVKFFTITRIQYLNKNGSDHCPLPISCSRTQTKVPSSFRFLHAWVLHHDFKNFMEKIWNQLSSGSGIVAFWSEPNEMARFNDSLIPSLIFESDNANLCSVPTMTELKEAIFNIDKDSVAGLDGFSSYFYQQCWDIVANDLLDAVVDFFQGRIDKKAHGGNVVLKLDLMEAYDRLDWNFLYRMLQ
ncbi:Uncharacterized protein TCM_010895 [Theobroma cacao]|uniref:Reverse transcriptase domain-containing protein n=1 Tax=Theobroma cacao TaxID=3641 RepID=A0A061E7K9_THECC|nr:Uncharacterized protein TCM_010895 [Theobroma cacao]